jgi:peptidoglycan/LPS O-acetylase OafA/YrhL
MNTRKNLDLEFLRAMAILMTVLQHAGALFWPGSLYLHWLETVGLWAGVGLFFCISGFIITSTFLASVERAGRYHPSAVVGSERCNSEGRRGLSLGHVAVVFWIKRVWRLWPAAWCGLALAILCAVFFNTSGIFGQPSRMAKDALMAFFHVANFHWARCYHISASADCNLTGWALVVYWSLSLEEQFYLLTPVLLLLVPRRRLIGLLVLIWLCQLPWSRPPLGVLWFFRVDSLVVGVLIALWRLRLRHRTTIVAGASDKPLPPIQDAALLILSLSALIALAWLGAPSRVEWLGVVNAISLAAGVLVWVASLGRRVLMPGGPLGIVLTWLGARSYSLYLTHMLALLGTREIWFRLNWHAAEHLMAYLSTAIIMTLSVAELSYRLIEQPARRYGYRLAARYGERHLYSC